MERGVVVVLGEGLLRNVQLFLGPGALPLGVLAIQLVIPAFTRHIKQRRGRAKWKQHHVRSDQEQETKPAIHMATVTTRNRQVKAGATSIIPDTKPSRHNLSVTFACRRQNACS